MVNYKICPTRITQRSRFTQIREWLAKQKEVSTNVILVVIENEHIMIHSAAGGNWIVSIDWSGEQILITDSESIGSPYAFRTFKNASMFLNEMLTHYGDAAAEFRVKSAPLAAFTA